MDIHSLQAVRCAGVQFSREAIAKVYGARTEFSIPRHDIRSIRLVYGPPGERRWLQLLIGLPMLLAGVLLLLIFLLLLFQGVLVTRRMIAFILLIGIGGWITWDAFRSQWYVEVETMEKTRKLAFDEKIDSDSLKAMLQVARQFGYSIDSAAYESKTSSQPGSIPS